MSKRRARPVGRNSLTRRLPVGAITVNDVLVPTAHPETPFGGRKSSGWGVPQGTEGLLERTVAQVVTHRSGSFRMHIEPTLNRDLAADDTMRGVPRFTHGRRVRDRWRGFGRMVAGFHCVGKATGR